MSTAARIRRGAAALAVVGVIALGGCTSTFTAQPYTPGVGTNADAGDVKLRGMVLVADGGTATLTGALVNTKGTDELTGIKGTILGPTGEEGGELTFENATASLKKNQLVTLTDKLVTASGDFPVGSSARLVFTLKDNGESTMVVPVVTSDHPDYKDLKQS